MGRMIDLPNRASDAGSDIHDPSDDYDVFDWLDLTTEEIRTAYRAGKGASRMEAIRRARAMLVNAADLAEREILIRWQALGMNEVIPERVAPSREWMDELARDMRALGWIREGSRYVRPKGGTP